MIQPSSSSFVLKSAGGNKCACVLVLIHNKLGYLCRSSACCGSAPLHLPLSSHSEVLNLLSKRQTYLTGLLAES